MKLRKSYFNIVIFISAIVSFIITLINYYNFSDGYNLMILFPIVFLLLYAAFISSIDIKKVKTPITISMFLWVQWIRYILMPPIMAIAGEFLGTSFLNPSVEAINLANILMIVDLAVNFILIGYIARISKRSALNHNAIVKGNKILYIVFIIFALLIYIVIGIKSKMIGFLIIPVYGGDRVGDITDSFIVILRQIVLIGVFLSFILGVNFFSKKYNKTKRIIYFNLSILLALLNVSIIVGERRTSQVYAAFCSIWILCYAYPQFKKKIFLYVGGLALFILVFMSIYKFSSAFIYGSYIEALKNSNFNYSWGSQILQSYFAGSQDIAVAIEFSKIYDLNIENLIYDFMRSTVPISFFVKGIGNITSQLFNLYIYGDKQSTGHIISTTAYSYMYFGIIFSWIFSAFNILISYFIESNLIASKSYEMMYVWAYILIRFTFSIMTNTPQLMTSTSIMLVTAGVLFKVSEICRLRRKYI